MEEFSAKPVQPGEAGGDMRRICYCCQQHIEIFSRFKQGSRGVLFEHSAEGTLNKLHIAQCYDLSELGLLVLLEFALRVPKTFFSKTSYGLVLLHMFTSAAMLRPSPAYSSWQLLTGDSKS